MQIKLIVKPSASAHKSELIQLVPAKEVKTSKENRKDVFTVGNPSQVSVMARLQVCKYALANERTHAG